MRGLHNDTSIKIEDLQKLTYLSETMLIGGSSKRSKLCLEANRPQYYQVNSSLPARRSGCWPWNPEICLEDAIATFGHE